jgi:hypothetical protein
VTELLIGEGGRVGLRGSLRLLGLGGDAAGQHGHKQPERKRGPCETGSCAMRKRGTRDCAVVTLVRHYGLLGMTIWIERPPVRQLRGPAPWHAPDQSVSQAAVRALT